LVIQVPVFRVFNTRSVLITTLLEKAMKNLINYVHSAVASVALIAAISAPVYAESPADLNDLEIAHVAYIADNIDIRYAHLALGMSENPDIREFAKTMIRDHESVNEQALALLERLGVSAQDNFLSQKLISDADGVIDELTKLRGAEFDRFYAENELNYHKAVNNLVEEVFIPNIGNSEVKNCLNRRWRFLRFMSITLK
jgi:putative membrane protein